MSERTFTKRANGVTRREALAELFARYPKAKLVDFEEQKTNQGLVFEATLKSAEFGEDDGGEGGEPDAEPKPKPKKKEEGDAPDPDSDGDEDGDDDSDGDGPPLPGLDGGLPKPKPEEQMLHVLEQILHTLQSQSGGGPGGHLGPEGPPLPDIGAPPKGGQLPPPKPGGPGPGAPPPVPPKAPMGGPAFSHYNSDSPEIVTIRRDATEVGNKAMIAEARKVFPTHKVARIQRTGKAVLNGKTYDLPKNKIAVIHLVKE
jgi:hypothetical protein